MFDVSKATTTVSQHPPPNFTPHTNGKSRVSPRTPHSCVAVMAVPHRHLCLVEVAVAGALSRHDTHTRPPTRALRTSRHLCIVHSIAALHPIHVGSEASSDVSTCCPPPVCRRIRSSTRSATTVEPSVWCSSLRSSTRSSKATPTTRQSLSMPTSRPCMDESYMHDDTAAPLSRGLRTHWEEKKKKPVIPTAHTITLEVEGGGVLRTCKERNRNGCPKHAMQKDWCNTMACYLGPPGSPRPGAGRRGQHGRGG